MKYGLSLEGMAALINFIILVNLKWGCDLPYSALQFLTEGKQKMELGKHAQITQQLKPTILKGSAEKKLRKA